MRKFATFCQDSHGIALAKVMQGKGAKHDIIRLGHPPFEQVCAAVIDFGITAAEFAGDGNGSALSIDCINTQLYSVCPRESHHQARNVARAGREIEQLHAGMWT